MSNKYILPEGSLISYFSNKVKLNGGINLAQGLPGFQPPLKLQQKLSEISLRNDIHQYAPGIGNFKLIELIQQYYKKYDPTLTNDSILITQGATEAITLVYLYHKQKYGKLNVLGFDPVYESYNNLPKNFGDNFFAFTFDNNILDLDKLENTIRNNNINLLFINSPGNPLGRIFKENEIKKIIELSEKYKFSILIDAVYRELYFYSEPYIPFNTKNQYLYYVNSFSKLYSITGWRVGYLICDKEQMKKIRSIHDYTGLCVANPIQTAIKEYIAECGFINEYVHITRKSIFESFSLLQKELNKLKFTIPTIEGGYFIWAELPTQFDDCFRFAVDLYDNQKVAIIPGIHFSQNAIRFVRFNAAHPISVITKAIECINNFFNSFSAK